MAISIGHLPGDVQRTARTIVDAYRGIGGLAFGYGQGSVFVGFSRDADLDINLVWDRASPPPDDARPVALLCDGEREAVQFDQGVMALDKLWVDGHQVDVAHHTKMTFDSWLEAIRCGDGWREVTWPLPLFAVSGFYYGVLLHDASGAGASAHASLARFPDALIQNTGEVLTRNLPMYQEELAACIRRGDNWLFHDLLGKWMREIYIVWFTAERRYCPYPKRLHRWIVRFQMDPEIAVTERQLWEAPDLNHKIRLATTMVEKILRKNKPSPAR